MLFGDRCCSLGLVATIYTFARRLTIRNDNIDRSLHTPTHTLESDRFQVQVVLFVAYLGWQQHGIRLPPCRTRRWECVTRKHHTHFTGAKSFRRLVIRLYKCSVSYLERTSNHCRRCVTQRPTRTLGVERTFVRVLTTDLFHAENRFIAALVFCFYFNVLNESAQGFAVGVVIEAIPAWQSC